MSIEAISALAPEVSSSSAPDPAYTPTAAIINDHQPDGTADEIQCAKPAFLHSPPDSNNAAKSEGSDSELSDLDEDAINSEQPQPHEQTQDAPPSEDDIGEVVPDHWSGTVPVFRPTMHQFKDFKVFMEKIDGYGMKSGIVKVIPPQEWKDSLPKLDELVKQVRVREPIKQDIMGSGGTYRQVNVLHGRSYNLPQWRKLCEQSEHQPPARRGERRKTVEKPKPAPKARDPAAPKAAPASKKRGGAKGRGRGRNKAKQQDEQEVEDRPMTPVSPKPEQQDLIKKEEVAPSVEHEDPGMDIDEDEAFTPTVGRMGRMGGARPAKNKATTVSARRKNARREGSAAIDEEAFKNFDYEMDISDYTAERCEELERIYWKTLTYAPPLYGADMMGTLFEENTEKWNLNKLPNLLDVLGTKVPGVNTAYLYLGMWKATFAWHLEDVDLYSINYLHFGAPKQWYSISQGDARRFEAAMKATWPSDAKSCDQFLRHKGYLISPQHLKQHYNITVNKCLSYPGEFVVTYPYGYHSGYNLGYNCAEAVNFALDSWLPMGKIAKRCECAQAQDSVWVDVYEIERKLRGEETEYEYTDEEEDDEDEDDLEDASGLPSPPDSGLVKFKAPSRKRKRDAKDKDGKKVKKVRLRVKSRVEPPCCLCPNDIPSAELLPTDDGRKAHRICALYLPETYIDTDDGKEVIANIGAISKERLELKCLYCRSKRGGCFQCSQKKCARAYHATCAAAAGCFVEEAEVPVFGEDGTEYKEQAFEFSCRFHRTKRDRKLDGDALESDMRIRDAAKALKKGDICQLQYHKGDIFAGIVLENQEDEQMLLLDVIPNGDRIEVEWKWLLIPDSSDYHLPKASANALPLPTSRKAKDEINAKRGGAEIPRKGDTFVDGGFHWAEFNQCELDINTNQAKLDLDKDCQLWHYLGKGSTDAKPQYTESLALQRHNPRSNYLDTLPKPPKPAKPVKAVKPVAVPQQHSFVQQYPAPKATPPAPLVRMPSSGKSEKPYVYKPRKPIEPSWNVNGPNFTSQQFAPQQNAVPLQGGQQHTFSANQYHQTPGGYQGHAASTSYTMQSNRAGQMAHNASHNQGHQYNASNPFTQQRFTPTYTQGTPPPATAHSSSWPASSAGQQHQPPQLQQQYSYQNSGKQILPRQTTQTAAHFTPNSYAHTSPYGVFPQHPVAAPSPASQSSTPYHQSVYQKYPFFMVNHNRNRDHYRSPYNPNGGFMNGYEGNFRAHMMNAPFSVVSSYGQPSSGMQPSPLSGSHASLGAHQPARPSYTTGQGPQGGFNTGAGAYGNSPSPAPAYHPAIRPEYSNYAGQQGSLAMSPINGTSSHVRPGTHTGSSTSFPPTSTQTSVTKPLRSPPSEDAKPHPASNPLPAKPAAPKVQYKIPEKQTPVPLPPMYLASKKKVTATAAALATPSRVPEAPRATDDIASSSQTSVQASPNSVGNTKNKTARISSTPIPIPIPKALSRTQTPGQSGINTPAPPADTTPLQSPARTPSGPDVSQQRAVADSQRSISVSDASPDRSGTRTCTAPQQESTKAFRPLITETPVPLPAIPGRPAQAVTPEKTMVVAASDRPFSTDGHRMSDDILEKGGVTFADVPQDSMALVEQLMVNLRRASSHSVPESS